MKPGAALRARVAGFSLIELLVSMAIGLIVTLAITSVLIRSEGSKRSTTSVNDLNQTGAYSAFVLDRVIRSAGSGFSQGWQETYGCVLNVSQGGTTVLPLAPAIAAASPFSGVPTAIRLAPVVIAKGLANVAGQVRGDVLMVMQGTGSIGEAPQPLTATAVANPAAGQLTLPTSLGYTTDDLVLLSRPGAGNCMIQQVGAHAANLATPPLPLAGLYYSAANAVTTTPLNGYGATATAMQLGNAVGNMPQFQLFGVGANNTLFGCNLLVLSECSAPLAIADDVVEMRALYGIDTTPGTPGNVLGRWVDPAVPDALGDFSAATLTNGSAASQLNLRRIVAIRLGLILRTSLAERPKDYQLPDPTILTLFSDLALPQTRSLTGADLNYRYRTVELTIPLRNVLVAP